MSMCGGMRGELMGLGISCEIILDPHDLCKETHRILNGGDKHWTFTLIWCNLAIGYLAQSFPFPFLP